MADETSTGHRSVTVPIPTDDAFTLFTGRFDDFKPRERNLLGAPITETVSEPRSAAPSSTAATTEPSVAGRASRPSIRRIATWQIETDHDRCSEVEISFTADDPTSTVVAVEHRHLDRHDPGGNRSAGASQATAASRCTWRGTQN